jgi:hypothetical protein
MTLDPQLREPIKLTDEEFSDLLAFVRDGLQDQRVRKHRLCELIPNSVPSGRPSLKFTGCIHTDHDEFFEKQ